MKRCLLMIGLIGCFLLCACGQNQQVEPQSQQEAGKLVATQAPAEAAATKTPEAESRTAESAPSLAPSTNQAIVTEEEAPKVYWTMDIAYHLANCKTLSGQEPKEASWSLVKEIGLRQCPECNPPRYEGYVEAE